MHADGDHHDHHHHQHDNHNHDIDDYLDHPHHDHFFTRLNLYIYTISHKIFPNSP